MASYGVARSVVMTPAQARALVSGRRAFAPVRVSATRLAAQLEVRRLARELGRTTRDVVTSLVQIWEWSAAAWRPGSTWGEVVPTAVVDLVFDAPGAAEAAVRVGLASLVPVGEEDGIRFARLSGAPDIRAKESWAASGRKGAAERWRRHREGVQVTDG